METNFWGPYELTKLVLPGMRHQASGRVVNITSLAAVMSPPFEAVYAASKHALDGLSASLDLELDGTGVRVVTVLPGPHETGIQDRTDVLAADDSPYRKQLDGFHQRFSAVLASNPGLDSVVDAVLAAASELDPAQRVLVGGPLHDAVEPAVNSKNELQQLLRRRADND